MKLRKGLFISPFKNFSSGFLISLFPGAGDSLGAFGLPDDERQFESPWLDSGVFQFGGGNVVGQAELKIIDRQADVGDNGVTVTIPHASVEKQGSVVVGGKSGGVTGK